MCLAVAAVGVTPLLAVGVWALLDVPGRVMWVCIGLSLPFMGIGVLIGITTDGQHRRAVDAWGRGDRSDPIGAWRGAVYGPETWTQRAIPINYALTGAVMIPLVARSVDLSAVEIVVATVMWAVAFIALGLLFGTGFQLLLRPLLDEVAAFAPYTSGEMGRSRWSLRGRLFTAVFTTCFLAAIVVVAAVMHTDTRESQLVAMLAAATGLGVYMLVLVGGMLVEPTLRPLGDLMAGTERVRRGDFASAVPVTSGDEFGELASAFNDMQHGLQQREALHAAFGSYVDPALAHRLLESGSSVFEGEEVEVTVMFLDVRSFTSYSETVAPAEAVALLNRLFDVVIPIVHEHLGHANHYLGDGLLAVFGAPQPLEHHADAAVAAAVEIQRGVRTELGDELRLGIGINTGPVIAGTVGGGGRHEFTVIGDTVNTASGVEQLTKETHDRILMTDATRMALSTPRPRSTKRGAFGVKGKTAKVVVHALNPFPRSTR